MCGVFGYIGEEKSDLSGFLLHGLSKLEYRGYDSAGIAVYKNGKPKIVKTVGEIKNLKMRLNGQMLEGHLGIGHTRWATHGGVNRKNAHPHTDCSGKVVVVHNGIIENFEKIKERLIRRGHHFKSETDTEVFAHLVEEYVNKPQKKNGINDDILTYYSTFAEAVRLAFNELDGLNAVVAISPKDEIVSFKKGSPLVAGVSRNAKFISSDIPALISETKDIVFLNENQGVLVNKKNVYLINAKSGKIKNAKTQKVEMSEVVEDKGNFPHFLLKEIYEQPEVVAGIANYDKKEIRKATAMIKNAWGTYFTACGTAAYAGLAATYMFSEIAKRHVNFTVGSEFPYFEDFLVERSLLIAASQSGETMDTLEAVRAAKKHKSKVLALVNVPGSTLSRMADEVIYLKAGPERAVLSTKSYIAKLSLFLLISFAISKKLDEGVRLLRRVSKQLGKMLGSGFEQETKKLARLLKDQESIYVIGRGINYATALEGALKIKEASYIHAEGMAGGELKHGTIALIEKGTPCIVIVANDRAREAVLSNSMELKSRGGKIIGIAPKREKVFDNFIKVPDAGLASCLVSVVPLQLLAYQLSILKGNNPDKPRNLAKSVTVK